MKSNKSLLFALTCSTLLLAACDLPFLSNEEAKIEAKRQAEGMAVGSGCRYSGRALEECYGMNPKMSKAAIFSGWREMDGYMRENNIQAVAPEGEEKSDAANPKAAEAAPAEEKAKAADAPAGPEKPKAAEAPKGASPTPEAAPRKVSRRVV